MSNFVKVVAHPETGAIITATKKEGWGTVRVDAESVSFSNGIVNKRNRTAFIRGEISTLKQLAQKAGQLIPGKIVRYMSYSPFYDGQSPVINPTTSEVMEKDGKEYYQSFQFTDDLAAGDAWVANEGTLVPESVNVEATV